MLTLRIYKYTGVELPRAWPANKVVTTQNWTDFAVPFVAGTGKSAGQHTASVDPTISLQWIVFPSATEPDDLNDSLTGLLFDLSAEFALAKILKMPRSEDDLDDGEAVRMENQFNEIVDSTYSKIPS